MLTLFIDADGCPVKDETYKVAARYKLSVYVVANKHMRTPLHTSIEMVVVSEGADAADDWIAEKIQANDICITSDIPLADRCLKKGAYVLGHRGDEFNEDMIGDALATRDLMKSLRESGLVMGGAKSMEQRDRSQFLNRLDQVIQKIKIRLKS
jgi:uncharacterized protein YaiI (UPF0178 family)